MTQLQRTELDQAIERVHRDGVAILARGVRKADGARIFGVTSKTDGPVHLHAVVVIGQRLECDCRSNVICKHRVFAVDARRGKTSVGWFYGFKLHLVVNDRGELLAYCLTPGNVDDRRPVPRLVRRLFGKLFGERGYISQALAEQLFTTQGIALITKVRQNMRERVLATTDKLLLRKRAIIESVNDQLKNICQIEHTRHRSPYNFLAHLLAGLVAYCHQPKKPSLHVDMALDLLAAG